MGVFKEEVHFLESLAQRQQRIWGDSADYGVLLSDMTDSEIDFMRTMLKDLLELPGCKVEWKAEKPAVQRQYRIIIMWGRADDDPVRCDTNQYPVSW